MSEQQTSLSVFLISGPCGVGKSTLTKALSEKMEMGALIEGDFIHSMFIGKEQPSWEDQLSIVWKNILSLTINFIENNLNVMIDYVVEDELEWFRQQLSKYDATIYYVVLRADEESLVNRLVGRGNENLIDRSLFLLNQLENNLLNKPYLYDTTDKQPDEIVNDLRNRMDQFRLINV